MLWCMNENTPMLQPERINELMQRRGWDVGILAYRSGVKSNTIYKYLQGTRKVQTTLTNLAFLARALGCSIEYLIGMTDVSSPTVVMNLSPSQQEIIHKIGELSPRRQRELAIHLQTFLDLDAQDREWVKRNIEINSRLIEFVRVLGGEDAFFDLLDSLGKPGVGLGLEDHGSNPDDPGDNDNSSEALDDVGED